MPAILEYKVTEKDENRAIGHILRKEFNMSATVLKKLKDTGRIFLNGNLCKTIDIAKKDDIISADVSENISENSFIQPFKGELEIIYEDDFLIAVNKPGQMETHPCPSNRTSTLANIIMYFWQQKGEYHNYHIVNRLDKDTSGICIIAKNAFSHGVLSAQQKNGDFKKEYIAVVHGEMESKEGEITKPIGRSDKSIIKREVCSDGKFSKTLFKTVETINNFSIIKVTTETGRTHQIRVHFSHIGHPLVGDWLYGCGDKERHLIKRHALHAERIEFYHPQTKEKLIFTTNLPDDIKKLINSI